MILYWNFYKIVLNFVEKSDPVVVSPFLEWFPTKLVYHGRDRWLWTCVSVGDVLHKSGGSPLDHLNLSNIFLLMRVPNTRTIFEFWTDRGLVGFFLELLWTSLQGSV